MRWKTQTHTVGNVYTKSSFLLFPKTISGETRWLEFAKWETKLQMGLMRPYWSTKRWMD